MGIEMYGGCLEAIVRGRRFGILTAGDNNDLCRCKTLDEIMMQLSATDYDLYLPNGTLWSNC